MCELAGKAGSIGGAGREEGSMVRQVLKIIIKRKGKKEECGEEV